MSVETGQCKICEDWFDGIELSYCDVCGDIYCRKCKGSSMNLCERCEVQSSTQTANKEVEA